MQPHTYSSAWYSTFLDTIPAEQTAREVSFIMRQIPLTSFSKLLDVCCGSGRHASQLAHAGYEVIGIDNNADAIARARNLVPSAATYLTGDMRQLDMLGQEFDGVINLWASFGYFDDATNEAIVAQISNCLRPGGRALIDVYNRDHMSALPEDETVRRGGLLVATKRKLLGNRFRVQLQYSSGASDDFEWRLYTPEELSAICAKAQLDTVLACAWFDESIPASAAHARMQLVLERRNTH